MARLLFIDDDPQAHKTLRMVLDEHSLLSAYTAEQGFGLVTEEDPDAVLLDIDLPDQDGIQLLSRIQDIPSPPPVIMLTAYSDIPLIVQSIKAGAYDYVPKPYTMEILKGTIRQALQSHIPSFPSKSGKGVDRLIGESPPMCHVKDLILRFAPSGAPVLIQGESGTGKELVAKAIHEISGRSGPLIPVNCGAIPDTLVESELFGSVRGAYTDAMDREGAFEMANRGSLFLDEIGDMPLSAQVKLLRVLEEKQVRRLGSRDAVPLNVRVLAATQRNLRKEMMGNRFREDLYYRLGVLRIGVPPLRERLSDLGMLSAHLLQGKRKKLVNESLEKLMAHTWPGNVRELKNVIERAVLISEGKRILPKDIVLD